MKKYLFLGLLFLFRITVFANEPANSAYNQAALNMLEKSGFTVLWNEIEKKEFIDMLSEKKISIQTLIFVLRNMPEDLKDDPFEEAKDFFLTVSQEMDIVLKKGMALTRAKQYFQNYINSVQKDSQKQKKMLKSYRGENSGDIEGQYRYRQFYRYQKGKEQQGTGGNNPNANNLGAGHNPMGNGTNNGNGQNGNPSRVDE